MGGVGRADARAAVAGGVAGCLPLGGHCVEALDDGFELANGRAQAGREHGVLGGVLGDGGDQQGDDRGQGLAQGSGGCMCHS